MDLNNYRLEALKNISRRHFLRESAAGLGIAALGSLLPGCTSKSSGIQDTLVSNVDPMFPKPPHFPGKAKQVIYLHMAGAPSQLELFDFKPELKKIGRAS